MAALTDQLILVMQRFETLKLAAKAARSAILNTQPGVFVPGCSDKAEALSLAADSICRLDKLEAGQHEPDSGLLLVRADLGRCLASLNTAKAAFETAMIDLRQLDKQVSGKSLPSFIERVLKKEGLLEGELKARLDAAGFSSVDLNKCYANVRELPAPLRLVSWSWHRRPAAIETRTLPQAIAMATALEDERTQRTALDLLARLDPGERLAYVKRKRPRVMVNASWYTDAQHRESERKTFAVSGILYAQQDSVPEIVWRSPPDEQDPADMRPYGQRKDLTIDPDPYIIALRLHRYLDSSGEAPEAAPRKEAVLL